MDTKLGKLMLKNTATNYVFLATRMLTAIFLTRIVFLGLGDKLYGYWTLLWAIFGYSLLLDFGFGKTVQKYTAEAGFTGDMKSYSKIISAVFFSYLIMSTIIVAATIGMVFFLEDLFQLNAGTQSWYYRIVFIIFGIGIATVFPSGIFPEILVGLKKLYLRNYIMIFNKLFELLGIYLIFKFSGSLLALALFSAVLNLSTNIIMAIIVFRQVPELKFTLAGFSKETLKHIADFSLFAYIVTIANMIIFKTDRIVLGVMVGMGGVAIYQLGTRIPEIAQFLTTQFQENLSPIAASLYKAGDKEKLRAVMFSSTRLTVFLSTCVFIVFSCLTREIMFVWLKVTREEVIWIAYVMMFSAYILVVFRSTANHFLLMTGHHRLVAGLAVGESIVNLALSIILIRMIGVIGVAIGTLIPNFIIGLFIVFPLSARYSKQSLIAFMFKVYAPSFFIGIPSIAFLWWLTQKIPLEQWNLWKLAIAAPPAGLIYLIIGWIIYVKKDEKEKLVNILPSAVPGFIKTLMLK
jgi:O-antigen/teichoic acid export membrane protein